MGIITLTYRGDGSKAKQYLSKLKDKDYRNIFKKYGERGVEALSSATPRNTGKTAESWNFTVEKNKSGYTLYWTNNSQNKGISIVILNQYGHATRNGGWINGIDFINPAIRPIFNQMLNEIKREVSG